MVALFRVFLSLFVFGISTQTWGDIACITRQLTLNHIHPTMRAKIENVRYVVGDTRVTEDQIQQAHQTMNEINFKVLGQTLPPPQDLVMLINHSPQDAQGGINTLRITIGVRKYMETIYGNMKGVSTVIKSDSESVFKSVLAHEYGHTVFYNRLLNDVPEIAPVVQAGLDRNTVIALNRAINIPSKTKDGTLVDIDRLSYRVMSRVEKKIPKASARQIGKLATIFSPYNELLADLVLELSSRKGIVAPIENVFPDFIAKQRSFSQSSVLEEWHPIMSDLEPHLLLGPVRGFIGKEILHRPDVLEIVYEAIARELKEKIKDPAKNSFRLDRDDFMGFFKNVNLDLINRIKEVISERKTPPLH